MSKIPFLDKGLGPLETPAPHPLPRSPPLLPPPRPLLPRHVVVVVVAAVEVAEEVVLPWTTSKPNWTAKGHGGVWKPILLGENHDYQKVLMITS